MSKWTDHIKQFAKDKGISYKDAMKSAECKSAYKSGASAEPKVELKIEEIKRKRGRPKKIKEEAPKMEAPAKVAEVEMPIKKRRGRPPKVKGEGLIAGYKAEAPNGLGHIYPVSHEMILEMVKRGI